MLSSETSLNLKLTEPAVQQVKNIIARDKLVDYGLRVAVTDGGCSGMSYQLKFDREPQPGDKILNVKDLKIYVDGKSAPYLEGTVIDFAEGLYGGGFKFTNPNATGTCGCGTSFSA